jgi:hypothetical protein
MSDSAQADAAPTDLLAGLGSAAGLLVGTILLADLLGSFGDPDLVFAEHFADTGNRAQRLVGSAFLFVGGVLFLPFASGVAARVSPRSGDLSQTVRSLATVIAALVCVAAATLSVVDLSRLYADAFDEAVQPFDGNQAAVLPQLGYVLLLVAAAYLSAVVVGLLSLAGLRRGGISRGAAWFGLAIAVLLLLSPAVLPFLLLPVWILVTTVTTLRSGGGRTVDSNDV